MARAETRPVPRREQRPSGAAPVVAYGPAAVLRVPTHVAALGARRVMLVCGRRSFEASGAAEMLPALERTADVLRWSGFAPNTDADDLRVGLGAMRDYDPDLVLGVGGGSAMDMAKLLAGYRDVPDDAVHDAIRSGHPADTRRERLVLVPTTSGSGAEATHFSVVYIGDDKYSVGGEGMRPDAITLDPALGASAPPYQRATSGIDAVAQAIESLWATGATARSRLFARIALRLAVPALEPFVHEAGDEPARAMCLGSHFAGRAIDISRTTAAHALSYGLTKGYGISHGHAVAMTLGAFIEAHADAPPQRLRPGVDPATHAAVMERILAAFGAHDGATARERFTALLERVGLDPSLSAAGARSEAARERLALAVNAERLGNNPVALSDDDLRALLVRLD